MTEEQKLAIDSYILSHYNKLLGIAFSILHDRYKAEEAVQQVFLIASGKPDALINSPNPVGWLINTLKYVIANMRRSNFADERLLAKATALYENAAQEIDIDDLLTIETLWSDIIKTPEFQFLKLFIYDGLSDSEVAEMYGITYLACRLRKSRYRKRLRELILEKYDIG